MSKEENKIDKAIDEVVSEVAGSKYLGSLFRFIVILIKWSVVVGITIGAAAIVGNIVEGLAHDSGAGATAAIFTGLFAFGIALKVVFNKASNN